MRKTSRRAVANLPGPGPTVSITAGFAPMGIGTETGGPNVLPASLGGLYGLTLLLGSVPIDGACRSSDTFDRSGSWPGTHEILPLSSRY